MVTLDYVTPLTESADQAFVCRLPPDTLFTLSVSSGYLCSVRSDFSLGRRKAVQAMRFGDSFLLDEISFVNDLVLERSG